jgi:hypothetical protein
LAHVSIYCKRKCHEEIIPKELGHIDCKSDSKIPKATENHGGKGNKWYLAKEEL